VGGARDFEPDILIVEPGDTVRFVSMASHAVLSLDGLAPPGAQPLASALDQDVTFTLTVEGIYGFVCPPHLPLGMVGVILVGKPIDLAARIEWAEEHLQGPNRRLIGKLEKLRQRISMSPEAAAGSP
jgi:pseudoazurin